MRTPAQRTMNRFAPLALALATFVVAGCGGADSSTASSSAAPPPSASSPESLPIPSPEATDALPEGWLEGLPLPASAKLVSLTVSPDGANLNSIWSVDVTGQEAFDDYSARLADAGILSTGTIEGDGMLTADYAGSGLSVNVVTTEEAGTVGLLINATRD